MGSSIRRQKYSLSSQSVLTLRFSLPCNERTRLCTAYPKCGPPTVDCIFLKLRLRARRQGNQARRKCVEMRYLVCRHPSCRVVKLANEMRRSAAACTQVHSQHGDNDYYVTTSTTTARRWEVLLHYLYKPPFSTYQ